MTSRSGSRPPAGLRNAATAEFLRAPDGAFHFLEVNTRLQVEHGVTELVTGLDIVHEQFRLAAGEPLSAGARAAAARAAQPVGHAIEVRLAAEDPSRDFAPGPGRIDRWVMPSGPGVRVDTGLQAGRPGPARLRQPGRQDHGPRRGPGAAIDRLRRALDETEIAGIQTTLPFDRFVARHAGFRAGDLSIDWVAEEWDGAADRASHAGAAAEAAARAVAEHRARVGGVGCSPGRQLRRRPCRRLGPRPPGPSPPATTRSIGGRV